MLQGGATPQTTGENPVTNYLVLGATLDPKIKAKVWAGQYVELSSLSDQSDVKVSVSVNKDDSLISLTPAKSPPPATIYSWLRLFAAYAAVYLERYPAQGPAMFSYTVRIFDLHRQYGGVAWRNYDEKFRRVKAVCPTLPWHTVNWDMAMSLVHPSANPGGQSQSTRPTSNGRHPFRGQSGQNQTGGQASRYQTDDNRGANRGVCFRFNGKGCELTNCRFKHACSNCGRAHSKQKCRRPANHGSTSDAGAISD
jgi:hypothetical protein